MARIDKSGKKIKNHESTGLNYRGTYEEDFLNFCIKYNINIDSFKGNIKYLIDDIEYRYYPDFFHKETNTIIEIKSNYTYERFLEKNKLKEKYSIKSGYNFLFVIDKDYTKFVEIIK